MTENNSSKFQVACFGEVLFDQFDDGLHLGGAPFNVFAHLNHQGVSTALISAVGEDKNGDRILSILKQNNLTEHWIQIHPDHQTGLVVADASDRLNIKYDIVEDVAYDHIRYTEDQLELIKQIDYVVYGSLGVRNEESRTTLFKLLNQTSGFQVCDINLRPPFIDQTIIKELMHVADLLKINEEEVVDLSNWFLDKKQDRGLQVEGLMKKFNLSQVCVTLGADGAELYTKNRMYYSPAPKVDVKDTTGSGDSFLATLVAGLINQVEPGKALQEACKIGGYIASQRGAVPHLTI